MSVSNHRSAEATTAGTRGFRAATVHVFVPKVNVVAVMPEAEYPYQSWVVTSLPSAAPVGKKKEFVSKAIS